MKRKVLFLTVIIGIMLLILGGTSFATEYTDKANYAKINIPSQFIQMSNATLYNGEGTEMFFDWEDKAYITIYTLRKNSCSDKIINETVVNGCTLLDALEAYIGDKDILNFNGEYVQLKQPNFTMFFIGYGNNNYGNTMQRQSWILSNSNMIFDTFAIESDDYVTWIMIRYNSDNPESIDYNSMTIDDWFWNSEEEIGIIESFQYITNNTNYVCNLDFFDVSYRNWFCEAVRYCYKNNIISGYDETTFAPRDNLTREQLVAILWRIEGKPDASELPNLFSDVPDGEWYTDAIKWAKANGIVNGYARTAEFGRGDKIIRQDLAKILYNFSVYKGINTDSIGSYDAFTYFKDYEDVSYYGIRAVRWAIYHGIISGNALPDGTRTIAPHDSATRAEAAVMIYKFCENVLNN